MRKNKMIVYSVCFTIILCLISPVCSCEKREPKFKPSPSEIISEISEQFPEYDTTDKSRKYYENGLKTTELSESDATDIYSTDKNKPVDLSKIEKYIIVMFDENNIDEIGIFKLYDKVNTGYVKEMAQTRITKMQDYCNMNENKTASEIFNNAEIRSYGVYVYYVAHSEKDKIFKIIEDALRGE